MEEKYDILFTDSYGHQRMEKEGLTLDEAFEYVKNKYPKAHESLLGYKALGSKAFHGNPSNATALTVQLSKS